MNEIINFYNKMNHKKLINCVCLDCFDTIFHRKLHPYNLKMMWSKRLCSIFKLNISPYIIYRIREESENSLMLEKGIILREYSYIELIQNVYNKMSFMHKIDISFNYFYQISIKLELDLEKEYGYVDDETKAAIEYFLSKKIKVAVVSDTYFSGNQIRGLLRNFEIVGIENIYTSSDYGDGKYSSKLYEKVVEHLKIEPANILMIGDNKKSDIICAKKMGFKTYYKKWRNYPKIVDYDTVKEKLFSLSTRQKRIAYENYAFALFYFIDKLYSRIKANRVTEILFLAREGEFLKTLFDEYLEKKCDSSIKTYYFCTSRISSFAARLCSLEEETFDGLFNKYKDLSILTFLKSMGWEDTQIKLLEESTSLKFENCIENFPQSSEFKYLKENALFIKIYDCHRHEQNRLLMQYLIDMEVDCSNGLNIVDVGWRGSIQDNLFRCFQGNINVHGYYIGISKIWENSDKNAKEGIVFSEYPVRTKNFEIWNFDKFMFERIMLASHPTTVGYKIEDGKVKPRFESFLDEKEAYQYILPYQRRVKELFGYIVELFQNVVYNAEDYESLFTLIHLNMLCKIGPKEVKMQEMLYNYNHESFGEFNKTKANYSNDFLAAIKMNKVPLRKILHNGINFNYIHSISITTICVSHNIGWILIVLYRVLYGRERKRIS